MKTDAGGSVVLPFAAVGKWIAKHKLTTEAGVRATDVHRAMVLMLTAERRAGAANGAQASAPPESHEPLGSSERCRGCQGSAFDAIVEEGIVACVACGLISDTLVFGPHFSYDVKAQEAARKRRRSAPKHRPVPDSTHRRMVQRNHVEERLHHFNRYTNYTPSDIQQALERACSALPADSSLHIDDFEVDACSVAALLLPHVDVAGYVQGLPFGEMRHTQPTRAVPIHRCQRCNAPVSERWEVRRHACNWGKNMRARASAHPETLGLRWEVTRDAPNPPNRGEVVRLAARLARDLSPLTREELSSFNIRGLAPHHVLQHGTTRFKPIVTRCILQTWNAKEDVAAECDVPSSAHVHGDGDGKPSLLDERDGHVHVCARSANRHRTGHE